MVHITQLRSPEPRSLGGLCEAVIIQDPVVEVASPSVTAGRKSAAEKGRNGAGSVNRIQQVQANIYGMCHLQLAQLSICEESNKAVSFPGNRKIYPLNSPQSSQQ